MVLSHAGTGHSGRPGAQAVPESFGWLLSSLLSLPTLLGHGRSVSGCLLGGVCLSGCPSLRLLSALLVFTGVD